MSQAAHLTSPAHFDVGKMPFLTSVRDHLDLVETMCARYVAPVGAGSTADRRER